MMPALAALFVLACSLGCIVCIVLIASTDWERLSRALIDLIQSWTTDGLYRRRVTLYRRLVLGDDVTLRESDLYLDRRFADRVEMLKRRSDERDQLLAEIHRLRSQLNPPTIP